MPSPNPVFASLPTTIFTHMSVLANAHGAVNLGQGFPDSDGPLAIRQAAARALVEGPNQYAPMRGLPGLRQAIADHARAHYGLSYDAESEVVVTCGATEALAAAFFSLAAPGGDIVLIEPSYDSYRPIAEAAGLSVRTMTLSPPDWRLTEAALAAAVTPDTRAILVNSPLNPVGRVFDHDELAMLARVLAKSDAIAICDEVYEHLAYDGHDHVPLAMLPGMRERCIRIGSAGKIFSLTGWKVGWAMGPAPLMDVLAKAHQFVTFATPPALQAGIAHGLAREMDFPKALRARLQDNRDFLSAGLARLGFDVQPCEGSYFLTAEIGKLTDEKDQAFCERLVREAGVAAIPLSVFFKGGQPDTFIRFVFCKERAVLEKALTRLETWLVG